MPSDEEHIDYRSLRQERLEELALDSNTNFQSRARAKGELKRRVREYAEQQEKSRRDFESAIANKQLAAANDVAWATKWALGAAFAAAAGAIVQAWFALASYHCR